MPRFQRQCLLHIRHRCLEILHQVMQRRALVPGFRHIRRQGDQRIETFHRQREIPFRHRDGPLLHEDIEVFRAGLHPDRPDLPLDSLGFARIGRFLKLVKKRIETGIRLRGTGGESAQHHQ